MRKVCWRKSMMAAFIMILFFFSFSHAESRIAAQFKAFVVPGTGYMIGRQVAVFPFSGDPSNGILTDSLAATLIEEEVFKVVERQNLVQILQEQGLSLTGALSETDYKKIGKILNLHYLIFGRVQIVSGIQDFGNIGRIENVTVRIVDLVTGEIIGHASFQLDKSLYMPCGPPEIGKHLGLKLANALKSQGVDIWKPSKNFPFSP